MIILKALVRDSTVLSLLEMPVALLGAITDLKQPVFRTHSDSQESGTNPLA